MDKFKNFLVFLLILVIVAIASSAPAAQKKRAIDWTEDDVAKFIDMTAGSYLREAKFTSAKDAETRFSTHLAAACQILKNEGIIYGYEIVAFTKDNDSAHILLKIVKDVDSDEIAFGFEILKNDGTIKPLHKGNV